MRYSIADEASNIIKRPADEGDGNVTGRADGAGRKPIRPENTV